jgi:hypothetical protein
MTCDWLRRDGATDEAELRLVASRTAPSSSRRVGARRRREAAAGDIGGLLKQQPAGRRPPARCSAGRPGAGAGPPQGVRYRPVRKGSPTAPNGPQEALRLLGRLEATHASLALACGLVRVLRSAIQACVAPVLSRRQHLPNRRGIPRQRTGDHHPWFGAGCRQHAAQEGFGCVLVTPLLEQHVQDDPVPIDRPPATANGACR